MRLVFFLAIGLSLFLFSGCVSYRILDGKIETINLSNVTLKNNTLLSGHIRISGTLTIPRGIILRIEPGTHVEFVFSDTNRDGIGDAGIMIRGTVIAEGTKKNAIIFSGDRSTPRSWSEILMEHSPKSRFSYSEFRNAHWGLHIHFSPVSITNCRFIDNYGALRFRSGPITIQESLFRGNDIGIRYIAANPVIRDNTFKKNISAVFIREGSTDPVITANNFVNNKGFAIKLGESQQSNIPAPNNFWGGTSIEKIEKIIYDKSDSDYLGRVLYHPFATKPFLLENPQ